MTSLRSMGASLARRLVAPIDIASLVYFRIVFGGIALWEVWRYANYGWIARYYIDPSYHFKYYGFSWVHPWPGDGMYWHFAALAALSVCILLGLFYRVAATLFFLAFSYVFLLEESNYLNHLYLFCQVSFLAIFVPAHRDFSLDARRRPEIRSELAPTWTLWLLRFQMGVCYSYAGIAKMNGDWLRGYPLRLWLPPERDFPIIGRFFTEAWFQLFFSYGGLLLDLLVPFFLLWRRTRWAAFVVVLLFHLTNARLFGIGIFPWLSLALTLLFFPADWPRRVFNYPRRTPPPDPGLPTASLATGQRFAMAAVGVWVALNLLIPLRHFLYPGNVSWTEEGHNFAWHQKLRDKSCDTDFLVTDVETGETFGVSERQHLTRRQKRKVSSRPHMILEFAHFLKRHYREEEGRDVEVRVDSHCGLNGRERQRMIDPDVDLAAVREDLWPKDWILPLEPGWPDGG